MFKSLDSKNYFNLSFSVSGQYFRHVREEASGLDDAVVKDGGRMLPANPIPVQPLEVEPLRSHLGQMSGRLIHSRLLRLSKHQKCKYDLKINYGDIQQSNYSAKSVIYYMDRKI